MLVQLGSRSAEQDVVDLLHECHGRIRKFLTLAGTLAAAHDVAAAEAAEVASRIARYFAVSYPLHLADEEQSILPVLEREGDVREALARMQSDHAEHEHEVARVVEICRAIEQDPHTLGTRRDALGEAAAQLSASLEPHLAVEEAEVFPALRRLPQAIRDELRAAMRARRETIANRA